ncbi:hypothetical protein P12024L_13 [Nonlabens phage P12024L]|uniref:Uncharacterized protein n=1 Tax=Nonlabens phage P12024L TaxID=1168479 RepID=I6RTB2_9CAUD|nr:hypothetical protein B618_gp13 [Nonlabens phage P12024L]AFM54733.1 hypothetical protein P12024L_13 [Nonlabens phage P12024L]
MIKFLQENWEVLVGLIGSVTAYFGGKKIQQHNEKKLETDALKSMQDVYDRFIQQTDRNFTEMQEEIKTLKELLNKYISQCSKCENNRL